jgi:hypothetical protein
MLRGSGCDDTVIALGVEAFADDFAFGLFGIVTPNTFAAAELFVREGGCCVFGMDWTGAA